MRPDCHSQGLPFHFLIASALLGFTASLIRLWSTSLLFPIVARRLSFRIFRLLLSMRFIRYAWNAAIVVPLSVPWESVGASGSLADVERVHV